MAAHGLILSCRPGRAGRVLFFDYTLTNAASEDLYFMDATPNMDAASRRPRADAQSVVVIRLESGEAVVGKLLAPLPVGKQVAVPVIPLAARLAPGASAQRRVEVAMPLAETSPYFADLTLRGYSVEEVSATIFAIGYWSARTPGFAVAPAGFAPDLFMVLTPDTAADAGYATQRFPTKTLEIFTRGDGFPRNLALGGAGPEMAAARPDRAA